MALFELFDDVLESKVLDDFIEQNYPNADIHQISAFKNSVAYAMSGVSGGYGGPSMREHLACSKVVGKTLALEEALEICAKPCFGEITKEHAYYLKNDYCFDDSPSDIEKAKVIIEND